MSEQLKSSVEALAACKAKLEQGNMSQETFAQVMIEIVTNVGQAFYKTHSSMTVQDMKTAEFAMQSNTTHVRMNDTVQQVGVVNNAMTAQNIIMQQHQTEIES